MADDSDGIVIDITPDDVKFIKKLRNMEDAAGKSGMKAGKSIGDGVDKMAQRGVASIGKRLLAIGATVAAAFAGRAIIAAAKEQENAVNAINTSLALAGTYSKEASQSFQDLASELQRTSTFGDETILQMGALARNFTRTNEEAEKLTRAAVDLSAATGMSLDGAVKNLGKTFAGLTGELGESVPMLRALTAEQLKAGAGIDMILERFGGAAAAQIRTFGGAWTQLTNIFGDLLENIGMMITKSPVVVALMNKVSEMFLSAGDSLKGFSAQGDVIGQMIIQVIKFGEAVNTFVVAPLEFAYNLVETAFNGIRTYIQGYIMTLANGASTIVGFFAPDSEIAQSLKMFADSSSAVFDDMAGQTKQSFQDILNFDFTTQSASFLEGLRLTAENAKELATEVANNAAAVVDATALAIEQPITMALLTLDNFKAAFKKVAAEVKVTVKSITQALQQGIATGAAQAFAAFGRAIAQGENALEAFTNAVLAAMGQMAVQLGTQFILQGTAYMWAGMPNGPSLIAAGAALAAFGGILSAVGGGNEGAKQGTEGGILGGVTAEPSEITDTAPEDIEQRGGPEIRVNVQGNVFDARETGLRIVEVINEAFDQQGLTLGRA